MEEQIAVLNQTRNLSELMCVKFDILDRDNNEKLWTYHEFETLMPILHEKVHDINERFNMLFEELWKAMKINSVYKQAA